MCITREKQNVSQVTSMRRGKNSTSCYFFFFVFLVTIQVKTHNIYVEYGFRSPKTFVKIRIALMPNNLIHALKWSLWMVCREWVWDIHITHYTYIECKFIDFSLVDNPVFDFLTCADHFFLRFFFFLVCAGNFSCNLIFNNWIENEYDFQWTPHTEYYA